MLSERSCKNLDTCDKRLVTLCEAVSKRINITVICGHRSEEDQNKAFNEGKSKLRFPMSCHNKFPSKAIDVVPEFFDWDSKECFISMARIFIEESNKLNIKINCGAFWKFFDGPHIELSN